MHMAAVKRRQICSPTKKGLCILARKISWECLNCPIIVVWSTIISHISIPSKGILCSLGLKVSLSLVTGVMTTVGGIFNILAGVFYTLDPIFPDSIGTGISRFQPHLDSNFPVPDLTGSLRSLHGTKCPKKFFYWLFHKCMCCKASSTITHHQGVCTSVAWCWAQARDHIESG